MENTVLSKPEAPIKQGSHHYIFSSNGSRIGYFHFSSYFIFVSFELLFGFDCSVVCHCASQNEFENNYSTQLYVQRRHREKK